MVRTKIRAATKDHLFSNLFHAKWARRPPHLEGPSKSGAKQGCDPITELGRETVSLKQLKNVVPTHGVKCFTDINIEGEQRDFSLV
jgi:hypothetical protein